MLLPPSNPAEDAGPRIIGATMAVTVLAFVTYSARMYSRIVLVRGVGMDDYFMSLAMAMVIVGEALVWASVNRGAGKHLGDIPLEDLPIGLKLNFISQPIFLIAICVVKLATVVLQCTDIRALWDLEIAQTATCWPQKTLQGLSYTNVGLNTLTDLCFAIFIPIPMLWNLNVNWRTRASLILALGLGCFACAAAIAKIPSLVDYGKTGDWLWDSQDICIWTVTECNVGIIAGSLPALRPMFKRALGGTFGTGKGTSGSGYQRHQDSSATRTTGTSRGGLKSVTDETSSERGFNEASYYEMGNRDRDVKGANTVDVFADPDALSSDETVNRSPQGRRVEARGNPGGITKTVTASVKFQGRTERR
ncbi:hypothetical protein B0T14DRAFT_440511 [Immersiella caudata]|uniref:Rhodopsin domain-containing protein n=1 Tax=Immersiella caudata TaxID=314043 RepID=A0AA39T1N2_9PEZI|nr:hypothetical protein B0T14DRAFT_440511 [Immersiella caudata]